MCLVPVLIALAGCTASAQPEVTDARVTLPVVAGRPGAAYFTVTGGPAGARLVGIDSPLVGRIELHDVMDMGGGTMRMAPLKSVAVDGKLAFAPGGRHAMLFDIAPTVKAGDALPLTFRFQPAATARAEARVGTVGD